MILNFLTPQQRKSNNDQSKSILKHFVEMLNADWLKLLACDLKWPNFSLRSYFY